MPSEGGSLAFRISLGCREESDQNQVPRVRILHVRQDVFGRHSLRPAIAPLKPRNCAILRNGLFTLASAADPKFLSDGRRSLGLFTSAIRYPFEFPAQIRHVAGGRRASGLNIRLGGRELRTNPSPGATPVCASVSRVQVALQHSGAALPRDAEFGGRKRAFRSGGVQLIQALTEGE